MYVIFKDFKKPNLPNSKKIEQWFSLVAIALKTSLQTDDTPKGRVKTKTRLLVYWAHSVPSNFHVVIVIFHLTRQISLRCWKNYYYDTLITGHWVGPVNEPVDKTVKIITNSDNYEISGRSACLAFIPRITKEVIW